MFFRNLSLFRFSEAMAASLAELETHLEQKRLRPCGPLEQSTRGFVSPHGRNAELLAHRAGNFVLVALGGEDKLLPGSVVNEELSARLQKITEEQGRRVGAKERKRMKDEILTDFLPRAFVKPFRMLAYADLKNGWLVVDTSSRKSAEEMLSELREAVGSFPATPMAPEESPRTLMTDWVVSGKLPAGLALADECELRDPAESGAIVRCRRQDLETDEVREHLKTGKQVYQLGLTFDDRISLVLGEDLVIRKLRFLDQVLDELNETDADSAAAELDSRMALMTLEVERLLAKLDEWFKLPRPTDH
ncbi:recombination-associated protein RdgC [Tahibacter harae]|uniref:Recombination-associated protein RdgC n=1 Tax=Tahibacter harae TaxID=2963937 RepID=A0ABT1QU14_9GAMM|nr:recombination-associated protein RdgC [Tahibacter harae]MCQ4165780.1 recombination-associated protein RdgC [Tahibacter harae]